MKFLQGLVSITTTTTTPIKINYKYPSLDWKMWFPSPKSPNISSPLSYVFEILVPSLENWKNNLLNDFVFCGSDEKAQLRRPISQDSFDDRVKVNPETLRFLTQLVLAIIIYHLLWLRFLSWSNFFQNHLYEMFAKLTSVIHVNIQNGKLIQWHQNHRQ